MFRKLSALFVSLLLLVSLAGCNTEKNDDTFIKNLGKGLEARWKITDTAVSETNAEEREKISKGIQAEFDKLGNLEDYTFESDEVAELASTYYDALNLQKEGVQYYELDEDQYNAYFGTGYAQRLKTIYQLNNIKTISVSSGNADTLDGFLKNGKVIYEEDQKYEKLSEMLAAGLTATFDGSNYQIIYDNNTGYDFDSVDFVITFYDSDDIALYNTSSYASNWSNGQKCKDQIYTYSEPFDHATIKGTYYRDYINWGKVETQEYPLTMDNPYHINIELVTELPVKLSTIYSWSGTQRTCEITDFSYQVNNWYDGKASVELLFSGSKIYDREGENSNYSCTFDWKLYNENGDVVDSGSAYTNQLKVGDTFKDESSSAYNLESGNYTLELSNDN